MIATTQDQAARLLRCGVSADTADMTLRTETGEVNFSRYSLETELKFYGYDDPKRHIEIIPAWSLGRLLELLPKRIKRGDCSDYTLSLSCDGCFWDLEYTYARYCGEDDSLILFEDIDPIEVCVKAIEWLMDNGYKLNEI